VTTTSIQFALDRGERQLWAGMPRQGLVLRPSDALQIPFSLLWAGFAVFWELSVFRSGAPLFFVLWGIPFVAVGFFVVIGRFWVDAWRRSRTTYAVTSERVIINSGLFTPTSKSLALRTLSDVTLQERSDGTGTITFGNASPFAAMSAGMSWPGMPQIPAFEMISDARRVYSIIREAQRAPEGVALADASTTDRAAVPYTPFASSRPAPFQGVQIGKHLKRLAAAVLLILGVYYFTSRGEHAGRHAGHVVTRAELDSFARLPTIIDTFIMTPSHVELSVGDTFRLSSLRMEARDRAGRHIHWDNATFSIRETAIMRRIASGYEAAAPGHASLLVEDRPRDFTTDSLRKRPWTRVDIDVRP
jgi:Bacterial PH domain